MMDHSGETCWEAERAWTWYRALPWVCGFNYVPSTAINTTEMWQAETFDEQTIDRELGWAHSLGFNTCRVFLQYLVWENDPESLLARLNRFLTLAAKWQISTVLCLFDDCAFSGKQPYLGTQDEPVPGVHNSGWTPSPGHERVVDRSGWPLLCEYVTSVISRFSRDARVVAWDIYNEPGNAGMGDRSLPLLSEAFQWAREASPGQPLTTGVWNPSLESICETSLALSDIISFHCYGDLSSLEKYVAELRDSDRPLVCTEWMARPLGSLFQTHLPFFKRNGIGCLSWGLVSGKTQTCFPWDSPPGAVEPSLWFHDIFHIDGSPYKEEEIVFIRHSILGQADDRSETEGSTA